MNFCEGFVERAVHAGEPVGHLRRVHHLQGLARVLSEQPEWNHDTSEHQSETGTRLPRIV